MTKLTESEVQKELFEQWLDHPVTQALMAKAERVNNNCKATWEAQSWGTPMNELPARLPIERLAYLRGKSAAFKSLAALKYTDLFKESPNDE